MNKQIAKEVAEEFNISEEEVIKMIKAMESLVQKNIRSSTLIESYETRIMGFGSFVTVSDKALNKHKKKDD
jgi:nucleoid DNA-binding protein